MLGSMRELWPENPENLPSRERLMYATYRCLIEKGHACTTSKEIAKVAGLNHGLIHHYFGSKENLYISLLDYMWERIPAILDQVETPREFLRIVLNSDQETYRLDQELMTAARSMPGLVKKLEKVHKERKKLVIARLGARNDTDATLFLATIRGAQMICPLDRTANLEELLDRMSEIFFGSARAMDAPIRAKLFADHLNFPVRD